MIKSKRHVGLCKSPSHWNCFRFNIIFLLLTVLEFSLDLRIFLKLAFSRCVQIPQSLQPSVTSSFIINWRQEAESVRQLSRNFPVIRLLPDLKSLLLSSTCTLCQGWTNPGRQVTRATKFCNLSPNICGSSVWIVLHLTLLGPRIFRWLGFCKVHAPLSYAIDIGAFRLVGKAVRVWCWNTKVKNMWSYTRTSIPYGPSYCGS